MFRGEDVQVYSFFNLSARSVEWSMPRLGRFTPGRRKLYTLNRRLGGPQGRFERVRRISLPPGFCPRTVQPVASRYT